MQVVPAIIHLVTSPNVLISNKRMLIGRWGGVRGRGVGAFSTTAFWNGLVKSELQLFIKHFIERELTAGDKARASSFLQPLGRGSGPGEADNNLLIRQAAGKSPARTDKLSNCSFQVVQGTPIFSTSQWRRHFILKCFLNGVVSWPPSHTTALIENLSRLAATDLLRVILTGRFRLLIWCLPQKST